MSKRSFRVSRLRLYSLAPLLVFGMVDCAKLLGIDCDAPGFEGVEVCSPFPTWAVGGEGGALGSDFGVGIRSRYIPANSSIGLDGNLSKYFPDAGSAYGGWIGARLEIPSTGAVRPYGVVGPTFLRTGYSFDEYDLGDFDGLGGGAFQQGVGSDSQTAYGVRLGVGAAGNNPESKWSPFGEVGYNLFLGGADFDNKFTFSGGVTYRIGGQDQPQ